MKRKASQKENIREEELSVEPLITKIQRTECTIGEDTTNCLKPERIDTSFTLPTAPEEKS